MLDDEASCSCGCPGWEQSWPHWWRVLCVDTWWGAEVYWQSERERVALGYATEMREFAELVPRPTFKKTLVGLAGSTRPLG